MTITAIAKPLPGERVIELSPADAAAAAQTWLHRPNLFPGRALTAQTLAALSAWAAGHVAQRGQAFTPGVVQGLDVGLEIGRAQGGRGNSAPSLRLPKGEPIAKLPYYLRIAAGRGLMATGEDVVLPHEVRINVDKLPVVAPPGVLSGVDGFGSDGDLQPRVVGVGPAQNFGALAGRKGTVLPLAGVLVLQAVTTEQADADVSDPCDRCACDDDGVNFEDWRIADGARLVWYAWPVDAEGFALPEPGPQFRNRLAWSVFDAERRLAPDRMLPWEPWGVALAVIGLDVDHRPSYVDSAAVRRRGGLARDSRLQLAGSSGEGPLRLGSSSRLPALWQAQIEQLAEQIAETDGGQPDPYALGEALARLPPCGVLPRSVIDLDNASTALLPDGMLVDVAPIPLEQLDLALRESAPLAPFDKQPGERLRLLVPVSQASFEPRLLLQESIDPLFAETLQGFLESRARALVARQILREKAALMLRVLRAQTAPIPEIGADPQAPEPETIDALFVPPGTGGHRTLLQAGAHGHRLYQPDRVTPQAKDQFYCWVQLDPDHPPRSLELIWETSAQTRHRAWWGEALVPSTDQPVARIRIGNLPETGRWVRLTVTAAALKIADILEDDGKRKATIAALEFRIFDGRAAFGQSGCIRGKTELVMVEGLPPRYDASPNDEPLEGLTPLELRHPFEETHGVTLSPGNWGGLSCLPLNDFLSRAPFETLSSGEYIQFSQVGIERFVKFLGDRVDRADDLVDLGFAKVQADIYRIRQLVLDTTDANRLGVSSALAGIAQAETSTVSNERLGRFFGELQQRSGVAPSPPKDLPPPPKPISVRPPTARPKIQLQFQTQVKAVTRAPTASIAVPAKAAQASPLVGNFSLRSVSLAERLKRPPALEALEFAVATRHEVVSNLLRLAEGFRAIDGVGIDAEFYRYSRLFDGLEIWLLEFEVPKPGVGDKVLQIPFERFLDPATRNAELTKLLTVPQRANADEGSNFSDASDITDRTVALLRQFEGCIQRYRDLIDDFNDLQGAMRGHLIDIGLRERIWQDALDEARHDVAVTRALILEEQARLDAINARRQAVLKEEFRFAAFIRPRTADTLDAAVSRPLDPGLLPAPVPACLAEHDDAPDELREMLVLLREAPARWFGQGPKLIEGLDRIDLLVRTVQHAQARAGITAQRPSLVLSQVAGGLQGSIAKVQAAQRQAVTAARASTLLDPSRLALGGWQAARRDAAEVISLGDLIDGDHGRNAVSRAAADFVDRFSRVCGCLHGGFSAVLPAIRLDWAETLSQFDESPNLRNLGSLPHYAELPFADRRRLQGLVDWLFDQIELTEPRATSLVNDLVRMCLLLASHAPIGRIIAGRLPRPVTARPGLRIALAALEPGRLRIGMQALIHRNGTLVARAVVEDLGDEEISARVIHTVAASEALDDSAQVQFTEAAALVPAKRGSVKTPKAR